MSHLTDCCGYLIKAERGAFVPTVGQSVYVLDGVGDASLGVGGGYNTKEQKRRGSPHPIKSSTTHIPQPTDTYTFIHVYAYRWTRSCCPCCRPSSGSTTPRVRTLWIDGDTACTVLIVVVVVVAVHPSMHRFTSRVINNPDPPSTTTTSLTVSLLLSGPSSKNPATLVANAICLFDDAVEVRAIMYI